MKLPFSVQLPPLPPMSRTAAKAGGSLRLATLPGGVRDADLIAAANSTVRPVRTGSAFRNPAGNISGYLQTLAGDKRRHPHTPPNARPGKKRFG